MKICRTIKLAVMELLSKWIEVSAIFTPGTLERLEIMDKANGWNIVYYILLRIS
jgi:hypothetical protein